MYKYSRGVSLLFQNRLLCNSLVALVKTIHQPLGGLDKEEGGGEWCFVFCCVVFCLYVYFSIAYCFNALTLCGLLLLNDVNLYLSLCCFSSSHISVSVISAQFILGLPTLLCSCAHLPNLLFVKVTLNWLEFGCAMILHAALILNF